MSIPDQVDLDGFIFSYQNRGRGRYTAHAHAGIELHFCEEGDGWFQAKRQRRRMLPGRVTLLYAPVFHHVTADPGRGYCRTILHIPESIVKRALSFVDLAAKAVLPTTNTPLLQLQPLAREHVEMVRVFRNMDRVRHSDPLIDPRITLYLAELFYIVHNISQRDSGVIDDVSPHGHLLVDRALAMLRIDNALILSPEELAEKLGVSRSHLWRVFTRVLGLSPREYLLRHRMELAKQELASGKSVSDVALLCGYADVASFSRAFRRQMGVPPRDFLRNQPGQVSPSHQ